MVLPMTAAVMWLIMGCLCVMLQLLLPGSMLFIFGLGAMIAALLSLLYEVSLFVQLLIFLFASLAIFFLYHGVVKKFFAQ